MADKFSLSSLLIQLIEVPWSTKWPSGTDKTHYMRHLGKKPIGLSTLESYTIKQRVYVFVCLFVCSLCPQYLSRTA